MALLTSAAPAVAADFSFKNHAVACGLDAPDISACEKAQQKAAEEYRQALRGDYQAQRNTAFCLYSGCLGYRVDKTAACAWRIVIVASGNPKVDQSDTSNYMLCERQLTPADMLAANGQARPLFKRVYKRSFPGD